MAKFCAENETLLKKAFSSEDKESQISMLVAKTEEMEKNMKADFEKGYSDVINKCTILDQLKEDVQTVKNANEELFGMTQSNVMKHSSLLADDKLMSRALERLKSVHGELSMVREFLGSAMNLESECDSYKKVKSVLLMEQAMSYFRKYSFYEAMNILYKKLKNNIFLKIKTKICAFISNEDWTKIGENIRFGSKFKIFDEIEALKYDILSDEFLDFAYASKKLGFSEDVASAIQSSYEELLQKKRFSSDDDVIYFSMGIIALEHYITEFFKVDFVDQILKLISQHKFKEISYFVPLKKLVVSLKVESEMLDSMIEKNVFIHFEKDHDLEKCSKKDFAVRIDKFVEESIDFLKKISQFSNELDELFLKKVDSVFNKYLDSYNGDIFDISPDIEATIHKIRGKKGFFKSAEFSVNEKIKNAKDVSINKIYDDLSSKILESTKISQVVEHILSIKNDMDEESRNTVVARLYENRKKLLSKQSIDSMVIFEDALKRNYDFVAQK